MRSRRWGLTRGASPGFSRFFAFLRMGQSAAYSPMTAPSDAPEEREMVAIRRTEEEVEDVVVSPLAAAFDDTATDEGSVDADHGDKRSLCRHEWLNCFVRVVAMSLADPSPLTPTT